MDQPRWRGSRPVGILTKPFYDRNCGLLPRSIAADPSAIGCSQMAFDDLAKELEALPHQGRLRLVDAAEVLSEHSLRVSATVTDRWPTSANGEIDAVVLVELVAQGAALLGLRLGHHAPDSLALLVGLPEVELLVRRVAVGTRLSAEIEADRGIGDYLVCRGIVQDTTTGDRLVTASVQGIRVSADQPLPWSRSE